MKVMTTTLSEAERERLMAQAQAAAIAHGIDVETWLQWRSGGLGLGRDVLMPADPVGEAERIIGLYA
jgi:hypothetical protein